MHRLAAVTALALTLSGCAAGRAYRTGISHELRGEDLRAAEEYLDAVSRRPRHHKARAALAQAAEPAYRAGLAEAARLEADAEYLEASRLYGRMDRLARRLRGLDLLDFETVDLAARAREMHAAGVAAAYEQAAEDLAAERWSDAVQGFGQVLSLDPRFRDSRA